MEHKTKRLYFREFTQNDFHLFYSVFSNEKVMRYALPERFDNEDDAMPFFNKMLENNVVCRDKREAYESAVFSVENNDFIGLAAVINVHNLQPSSGCGEIGYLLLPSFWGNGFGTEIANTLIEICFTHIKLHRVTAKCNSNNHASEKIMQKSGMIKEGELRKKRFKNGQWDNELNYSILIEEWKLFKS